MRRNVIVRYEFLLSMIILTLLLGCGESEIERHNREVLAEQKAQAEQDAATKVALKAAAGENFSKGEEHMKKHEYREAEEAFSLTVEGDPNYPGAAEALAKARAKREEREAENRRIEEEIQSKAAAEQTLAERRAMQESLRNSFLDSGLDIKVKVSGKNADRIQLTYVLFNDVWSHRLQKEGTIDNLCAKGFRRIGMSDGYDWGVYWNCR